MQNKQQTGLAIYVRLLKYVLVYKWLFCISFLGYLVASVTQPLFAEILKHIIDTLQTKDRDSALQLPFLFSGLIIIRSISVFIGSYFITRVSTHVVHDLRCGLFKHYTKLPTHYFDTNNTGYLISRITNNVQNVTTASTNALKIIIREGMTVIGLLAYLFYINWQLSCIFLSVMPIIIFVVIIIAKRLRKLSKRLQESVGDLTQIVSEIVVGNRVVKSYSGENYENLRFNKQSRYHKNQTLKIAVTSSLQNPIMQIIIALALSGLMYFALLLLDKSSTGEFIAYLTAAFMLPRAVKFISSANTKIQQGVAAAQSLFEVLDEAVEVDTGTKLIIGCKGGIEFKNVSFKHKGRDELIIKNINLKIKPGQSVALVGSSGSGKSTLVNLLLRFYDYNTGIILLDGNKINEIKKSSLRQQISLVSQNITLFNDTISKNISYGSDVSDKAKIIKVAEDAFVMEFVKKLEHKLDTIIGEQGIKLSGGQCQRLALARAMYRDAPILILDEASSALDTKSEKYIQTALKRLRKNKTTLTIAHRLSTIENADLIFVLEQGQIVEQGNHTQLINLGGAYAQLHKQVAS